MNRSTNRGGHASRSTRYNYARYSICRACAMYMSINVQSPAQKSRIRNAYFVAKPDTYSHTDKWWYTKDSFFLFARKAGCTQINRPTPNNDKLECTCTPRSYKKYNTYRVYGRDVQLILHHQANVFKLQWIQWMITKRHLKKQIQSNRKREHGLITMTLVTHFCSALWEYVFVWFGFVSANFIGISQTKWNKIPAILNEISVNQIK